jgi:hypothetical protein
MDELTDYQLKEQYEALHSSLMHWKSRYAWINQQIGALPSVVFCYPSYSRLMKARKKVVRHLNSLIPAHNSLCGTINFGDRRLRLGVEGKVEEIFPYQQELRIF